MRGHGSRTVVLLVAVALGVGFAAAPLPTAAAQVQPGIEVLLDEYLHLIEGKRVGLITNHTGIDSNGTHIADLLNVAPGVTVAAFFAPEHGLRGDRPAGERIASYVDPDTGVPVHSLYGNTLKPTPEMLQGIDVLLFDIQDVGTRFYTYIYTMAYAMEAAAEQGIPFIVLDRPNPIGGEIVEGPVLDPRFSSFVGLYPIALRHGMTVGELALFFNTEQNIGADLTVIPMQGWERSMWFEDTGLPWVAPSPNMRYPSTAFVYPGLGLLEGTNVSEGRGTARPFEFIGAPWIDALELYAELEKLNLPGVRFHPLFFTPTTSKYEGQPSQGVAVEVVDRERFRAVTTGLSVISTIMALYPDDFAWRAPDRSGRYFFDLLAGTDKIRMLLEWAAPVPNIASVWEDDLTHFQTLRAKYLLY